MNSPSCAPVCRDNYSQRISARLRLFLVIRLGHHRNIPRLLLGSSSFSWIQMKTLRCGTAWQAAEEKVELLPKPENFFPFCFFGSCVVLEPFFTTAAPKVPTLVLHVCDAPGFSRAACAELAGLDAVAAPPLQYLAFPKSSTAFPNFNNFRFVRFNPACCPPAQKLLE